jgi:hypothetical protein
MGVPTGVVLQFIRGERGPALFRVVKPFTWRGLTVYEGFVTDLESIPWYARWAFPRASHALQASIAHDFRMKIALDEGGHAFGPNTPLAAAWNRMRRAEAHKHLRDDLEALKVGFWRRHLMWRSAMIADNQLPFFWRVRRALFD